MSEAIVIGAGLFGQLIARGLAHAGRKVRIIDNREPWAGSPPAACLIRKEWCGKLPDGVFDAGMDFLSKNFLIHQKELFQFGEGAKGKKLTADWVDPKDMLSMWVDYGRVQRVGPVLGSPGNKWFVNGMGSNSSFTEPFHHESDLVIVAAGIWSQQIIPWYDMQLVGKAGIAYLFRDVKQPGMIIPWAPYKQIVGFDRVDGYYISDGSAILTNNWTPERKAQSYERCTTPKLRDEVAAAPASMKELFGIRPYVPEFVLCKELKPGLWVATGARKNGTLLGAYCAQKIVKETS